MKKKSSKASGAGEEADKLLDERFIQRVAPIVSDLVDRMRAADQSSVEYLRLLAEYLHLQKSVDLAEARIAELRREEDGRSEKAAKAVGARRDRQAQKADRELLEAKARACWAEEPDLTVPAVAAKLGNTGYPVSTVTRWISPVNPNKGRRGLRPRRK